MRGAHVPLRTGSYTKTAKSWLLPVEPALADRPETVFYAREERTGRGLRFFDAGLRHQRRARIRLLGWLNLTGFFAGGPDGNPDHRIHPPHSRAVRLVETNGESWRLGQHREISFHPALDVRGLVTMMAQAPNENSVTIEIVRLERRLDGGPEPDLLHLVAVALFAQRKVGCDPASFGVLRHVVRDRHEKAARKHPPALAAGCADERPIVQGLRLRRLFFTREWH